MGLVNGVAQRLHLTVALLSFPQFLLDGLELLAQEILTLAAIHDLLGLLADLVGKLQDLNAIAQKLRDLFQTAAHVKIFQNMLALLGLEIEKVGNQIRQCPGLLHMGDSLGQLLRHLRQESEGFGFPIYTSTSSPGNRFMCSGILKFEEYRQHPHVHLPGTRA